MTSSAIKAEDIDDLEEEENKIQDSLTSQSHHLNTQQEIFGGETFNLHPQQNEEIQIRGSSTNDQGEDHFSLAHILYPQIDPCGVASVAGLLQNPQVSLADDTHQQISSKESPNYLISYPRSSPKPPTSVFTCHGCTYLTDNRNDFIRHTKGCSPMKFRKREERGPRLQCDLCNYSTRRTFNLKRHMMSRNCVGRANWKGLASQSQCGSLPLNNFSQETSEEPLQVFGEGSGENVSQTLTEQGDTLMENTVNSSRNLTGSSTLDSMLFDRVNRENVSGDQTAASVDARPPSTSSEVSANSPETTADVSPRILTGNPTCTAGTVRSKMAGSRILWDARHYRAKRLNDFKRLKEFQSSVAANLNISNQFRKKFPLQDEVWRKAKSVFGSDEHTLQGLLETLACRINERSFVQLDFESCRSVNMLQKWIAEDYFEKEKRK